MLNLIENHLDRAAMAEAKKRWDAVAKPLNSLGRMEEMIVQIAGIQGRAEARLTPRCALVFCADHGVVAEGVSQSGSEVTALVAQSVAEGTSNVNLMAAVAGAQAFAVDMGMAREANHPSMIRCSQGRGTGNIARGPAMSPAQAEKALMGGVDAVGRMAERGYELMAVGEMGIGNTTSAAALLCALTGANPRDITGRGAGLSDEGLERKISAIERALEVNRINRSDPLDALAKVGGFELAGMAGAFLGGMIHRRALIIDGVISAAAALVAVRVCPSCREFMLPSHMSRERAGALAMEEIGLEPVIRADMALGEGSGAVMLFPLLDMANAVYRGEHTFNHLGMEAYTPQGGTKG